MSNQITLEEIEQTKYKDTLGLIGRKITDIRWLTKSESGGWFCQPIMITLDDGTQLIPQSDDEGNDAGAICVLPGDTSKEGDILGVQRW